MALQRSCQDAKLEIEDSDALCAREAPPSRGVVGWGAGGDWQEPLGGRSQPGRQARLALSQFLPGSSPAHWRSPRPSLAPASPPPPPSSAARPPPPPSPTLPPLLPFSDSRAPAPGRQSHPKRADRFQLYSPLANSGRSGYLDVQLALAVGRAARPHKGNEAAGRAPVNARRSPEQKAKLADVLFRRRLRSLAPQRLLAPAGGL